MILKVVALFTSLLPVLLASTAPVSLSAADRKLLDASTSFLRGSSISKVGIVKEVSSEIMERTTTSSGIIYVGGGKFRWETELPEKNLVLFDGSWLWTVQYPSPDFGGDIQATKSRLQGKAQNQILVQLVTEKGFSARFDQLERSEQDGKIVWQLQPKKDDPTVKKFSLKVDKTSKRLSELQYTDEIGNKTTLKFDSFEKIKKPDLKLFKMSLPKGTQVTEL